MTTQALCSTKLRANDSQRRLAIQGVDPGQPWSDHGRWLPRRGSLAVHRDGAFLPSATTRQDRRQGDLDHDNAVRTREQIGGDKGVAELSATLGADHSPTARPFQVNPRCRLSQFFVISNASPASLLCEPECSHRLLMVKNGVVVRLPC